MCWGCVLGRMACVGRRGVIFLFCRRGKVCVGNLGGSQWCCIWEREGESRGGVRARWHDCVEMLVVE